jgi:hypothetical protein
MLAYRFVEIHPDGYEGSERDVGCADDYEALALARSMATIFGKIEVWVGSKLIAEVVRPTKLSDISAAWPFAFAN